ncbi:MAG TPA: hypothetical protein PKI19_01265 [Elusimicrobiales bacterium]|nr:hypothetical protein [Elusimicrobiales bacterium]
MEEKAHKSSFGAATALAFLPLLLMGAGVWYYLSRQAARQADQQPAPAPVVSAPAPAASVPPAYLPGGAMPPQSFEIKGPPEFVSQVTQALKLVWTADRDTFLFLKSSLSMIRNENKTDFYVDEGRPVAAISTAHAFRSHTWCAGIIAHQAWHSWYKLKAGKKARPALPPPGQRPEAEIVNFKNRMVAFKGLDSIYDMENRASAFQLDVLKKVGAPAAERNLVFRRAPRDFATGHDGTYSLNP